MSYRIEIGLLRLPQYRRTLWSRAKMRFLLALPNALKKVSFSGSAHYCPVCQSDIRGFEDFGPIRKTWCPVCAAMDRHRLVWLFFQQETDLFDESPKNMLHIAPEVALEPRLKRMAHLDYLTADLDDPGCMVQLDITDIQFPDDTFGVIYCSHVLEDVPADREAMRECARVLKPDGWAVFMVPITSRRTDEDASVTNPAERERRFGQFDHVRSYGSDFPDRLEAEGFDVTVHRTEDVVSKDDARRMGLAAGEAVFFCRKRANLPPRS